MGDPLISIIISSYNYARYLKQTIDSALGQTYPKVEVIVVDDGSRDGSPEVIKSYGQRIIAILKENGGQASSLNAGFAGSHGDIVIFLDSDDFLLPWAAERVVLAAGPGTAKVQYLLDLVGDQGDLLATGRQARPTFWGEDARRVLLTYGLYASQPTGGNAFARWVLDRVLPIPEKEFPTCPDAYLNATTPFEGTVVYIDESLAACRLHASNHSSWAWDIKAVSTDFEYQCKFQNYVALAATKHGFSRPKHLEFRNYLYLRSRLACLRFATDRHPYPGDWSIAIALRGVLALWQWWGAVNWRKRMAWSVWFVLAAITPKAIASRLTIWFYNFRARPPILRKLAALIR